MVKLRLASVLFGAIALGACQGSPTPKPSASPTTTITVSAAASLQPALTALQPIYAQQQPTVKLSINFGGSGALKQQILQGAPVDLFIAADNETMDRLAKTGAIDPATRRHLLGNQLVLVARPGGPVQGWADLAQPAVKFVAIGNPATVPVGRYAKATLTQLQLWQAIAPKLVLGQDVRQVLAYVATGNADAGLVYATDARQNAAVQTVAIAPEASHPPILYSAAVLRRSSQPAAARSLLNFLGQPAAQQVFQRYGFRPIAPPSTPSGPPQ
ncbi:MAG: molybdate ABC transporter substrate-binding protein [Oscillatoriales cyanobacterium]|nr:MAG: molybdate ABC transporter substrate-binding protein [Oscillatoriales cyanobacterium]